MTHTAITPLLGRQFDRFLFASVGEDRNGTTLSVLSALARFDVDPWQETISLARMPRDMATERLTALIAAATTDFAAPASTATTVARLVALLPQTPSYEIATPQALARAVVVAPWRIFFALAIIALLFAGFFIFNAGSTLGGGGKPALATSEVSAPR